MQMQTGQVASCMLMSRHSSPARIARTRFMSSHTSRLADGLRSRYAGMIRRHQDRVAVLELAAAQPRDRVGRPQQALRGELAERDDHLRLDRVDLPEQERLALLHFVRLGIAVARRPALDHVGDVDVARASGRWLR